MKKFNLFKEIIIVKKTALLTAINSAKKFAITIHGEVIFEPFLAKEILIYSGKHSPKHISLAIPTKPETLADIFGKNYQIVEDDTRVLIKAFANWQELIGLNTPRASYDDTTADGVAEFSNKDLEAIGWHATEFDIAYRSLVELTEEHCDGTLLCIEQEEPYQFSGLGFFEDDKQVKELMFSYAQKEVKRVLNEDPTFTYETLSDDEKEAADFFDAV